MFPGDLVMQGATASVPTVLTKFVWNILVLVWEGLNVCALYKLILVIGILCVSYGNETKVNVTGPAWWLINISSANGLVPSGNKPLP